MLGGGTPLISEAEATKGARVSKGPMVPPDRETLTHRNATNTFPLQHPHCRAARGRRGIVEIEYRVDDRTTHPVSISGQATSRPGGDLTLPCRPCRRAATAASSPNN